MLAWSQPQAGNGQMSAKSQPNKPKWLKSGLDPPESKELCQDLQIWTSSGSFSPLLADVKFSVLQCFWLAAAPLNTVEASYETVTVDTWMKAKSKQKKCCL